MINLARGKEAAYHPAYQRTVQYSREARAYFTGVGVDEFLKQFTRRESKELFEQRKAITAHIQKSLGYSLSRPFAKVPRSNYVKVLNIDGDKDGRRAAAFQTETLDKFTRRGLDRYVFERLLYWNIVDPNCFVVVEFAPFDFTREKAKPYAFEVTAEMAVDYKYSPNGDLAYLVARIAEQKQTSKGKQLVERLTLYQPKQTVVFQQLTEDEIKGLVLPPLFKSFESEVEPGQIIQVQPGHYYLVSIPTPHNYEKTPAIRAGFVDDPENDGLSFVSIFDAAMPFAKKVLKLNSEADLTMALMAFPISVRYEDRCDAIGCNGGRLPDDSTCMVCHGTGKKSRPTSAQEEIVLDMPDNPADMVDLSRILNYVSPPAESIRLQVEQLQNNFAQAKEAVFNSQMFTRQEVAQTATYHGIELQSIYDTLAPYARHLGEAWAFLCDVCRAFTGEQSKMVARLIFPQDFRFETSEQIFAEMKSARDAGAGSGVTAILQERLMERLLIDDPERLKRARIDSRFNPFPGMDQTEIMIAVNSGLVPEWKRILWANYTSIIDGILLEVPDFYERPYDTQKQLVMAGVEQIQQQIAASQPALTIGAISDGGGQPQPNSAT